jgi:hypothetical protein
VKISVTTDTLARYVNVLESSGTSNAEAAHLRAFIRALEPVGSLMVDRLSTAFAGLSGSGESPRLGELISPLEGLLQLLEDVAKPKNLADLKGLLAVVREHGDTSIEGFASAIRDHVASASKGKSKKGAKSMNESLVADYLKKLEAALGNDVAFRTLFGEIEADKRITKLEAVALATRFLGPTPASTTRPRALQRVLQRHQKLMDFKRSSESIGGGRSAA